MKSRLSSSEYHETLAATGNLRPYLSDYRVPIFGKFILALHDGTAAWHECRC